MNHSVDIRKARRHAKKPPRKWRDMHLQRHRICIIFLETSLFMSVTLHWPRKEINAEKKFNSRAEYESYCLARCVSKTDKFRCEQNLCKRFPIDTGFVNLCEREKKERTKSRSQINFSGRTDRMRGRERTKEREWELGGKTSTLMSLFAFSVWTTKPSEHENMYVLIPKIFCSPHRCMYENLCGTKFVKIIGTAVCFNCGNDAERCQATNPAKSLVICKFYSSNSITQWTETCFPIAAIRIQLCSVWLLIYIVVVVVTVVVVVVHSNRIGNPEMFDKS